MSEIDQSLESLKLERSDSNPAEQLKKKTKARPMSKARLSTSNRNLSGSPIVSNPSAINKTLSGKRPTNPNSAFYRNRFSARRIGGPEYSMYHRSGSMQSSQGTPSLHAVASNVDDTPLTPISLGKAVPKPQELGNVRRNSKNDKARERSKSSLSGFSSPMAEAVGKTTETIIRYGELLKKGVVDTKWKKRFFLMTDKNLYYYINIFEVPAEFAYIDIPPKGMIPLKTIDQVIKDREDSTGTTFNIYTPARRYRLRMETDRGADAWVAAVMGACENIKQQGGGGLNAGRRESFSSIKADEVDAMSSSAFRDPTKQLRSEERRMARARQGNGPHQPAELENFVNWTAYDVAAWAGTVELGKYSEMFFQNKIDGHKLAELTKKEDVINLGIDEPDVMTCLNAIEQLRSVSALDEM